MKVDDLGPKPPFCIHTKENQGWWKVGLVGVPWSLMEDEAEPERIKTREQHATVSSFKA